MEERIISVIVIPAGETIFCEAGTTVTLADKGGGEFVEVYQVCHGKKIAIDPGEWPFIRAAIDNMVAKCRG